ncbi:hypothetical protein MKW94_019116, partial [Papaver nudicaule]|nr:hypothetical protein [Papaver nudicaule]
MEKAAKDAGHQFSREDHKDSGYDWLLLPPSDTKILFFTIPNSDAFASDPTTRPKKANGVE